MRFWLIAIFTLFLAGCSSYSVTENQLQQYVNKHSDFQESGGIKGLAYAEIKLNKATVGIGRTANDRISLDTSSEVLLSLLNQPEQKVQLNMNLNAIPYYNPDKKAVYLKSLQVQSINVEPKELEPIVKSPLVAPLINLISQQLTNYPVYKVKDNLLGKLIKSTDPKIQVNDHKLIFQF